MLQKCLFCLTSIWISASSAPITEQDAARTRNDDHYQTFLAGVQHSKSRAWHNTPLQQISRQGEKRKEKISLIECQTFRPFRLHQKSPRFAHCFSIFSRRQPIPVPDIGTNRDLFSPHSFMVGLSSFPPRDTHATGAGVEATLFAPARVLFFHSPLACKRESHLFFSHPALSMRASAGLFSRSSTRAHATRIIMEPQAAARGYHYLRLPTIREGEIT